MKDEINQNLGFGKGSSEFQLDFLEKNSCETIGFSYEFVETSRGGSGPGRMMMNDHHR